jgi:hypothetical protein
LAGDPALEADAMSAGTEYAIETDGLTRRFGEFTAVDRVTRKNGGGGWGGESLKSLALLDHILDQLNTYSSHKYP